MVAVAARDRQVESTHIVSNFPNATMYPANSSLDALTTRAAENNAEPTKLSDIPPCGNTDREECWPFGKPEESKTKNNSPASSLATSASRCSTNVGNRRSLYDRNRP